MAHEGIQMRTISIQELEERPYELATQVESGQRLTLIHGGKAIGDLVAHEPQQKKWASEEERSAAVKDGMAFLRKGINMGGFKVTDRDALYDRD
jgi:antitoxin (DNA-binding transcriptional repressor) of toxin-antitoxin stability system